MPMKGGRKSYPLWSWTQKWNMKRSEVAKIEVSKVFSSFHMNFIYCSTSSIGMILAALQIASISSTYYPSPRDGSLCSLFSIKNVNIYTRELCKLWFFFFFLKKVRFLFVLWVQILYINFGSSSKMDAMVNITFRHLFTTYLLIKIIKIHEICMLIALTFFHYWMSFCPWCFHI